jgi:hypothetical protein
MCLAWELFYPSDIIRDTVVIEDRPVSFDLSIVCCWPLSMMINEKRMIRQRTDRSVRPYDRSNDASMNKQCVALVFVMKRESIEQVKIIEFTVVDIADSSIEILFFNRQTNKQDVLLVKQHWRTIALTNVETTDVVERNGLVVLSFSICWLRYISNSSSNIAMTDGSTVIPVLVYCCSTTFTVNDDKRMNSRHFLFDDRAAGQENIVVRTIISINCWTNDLVRMVNTRNDHAEWLTTRETTRTRLT